MNKQDVEGYLIELDEALAEAFPSPEPMRVLIVYPLRGDQPDRTRLASKKHTEAVEIAQRILW